MKGESKDYKILSRFIIKAISRYTVLDMARMLTLEFLYGIGFNLMYSGQRMVTMPVFWSDNILTGNSPVTSTG